MLSSIKFMKVRDKPVWHRGEQWNGKAMKFGGLACDVSSREDMPGEVEDAIAFLKANSADLRRLASVPGIEWKSLDFGYDLRIGDGEFLFYQSEYLPPELLSLCGEFGMGIEISVYAPHPGEFKVVWPPGKRSSR